MVAPLIAAKAYAAVQETAADPGRGRRVPRRAGRRASAEMVKNA